MTEFWEQAFSQKQEMWGWEAADSALQTLNFFQQEGLKKILIPGFGYGRNAKIFTENDFEVTGIEISETAVEIAKKHFEESVKIHLGSVVSMPFDTEVYDGIFSYALLHLLSEEERKKLIADCYTQLKVGGCMVFVTIAKTDFRYGQGEEILTDTFEMPYGVTLYFYDENSIARDFANFGFIRNKEISEPKEDIEGKPKQRFWYIVCRKGEK